MHLRSPAAQPSVSGGGDGRGHCLLGAATVNDVGAARATLVGASRTVAVGVAGDPVVNTGRGAMPGAGFDDWSGRLGRPSLRLRGRGPGCGLPSGSVSPRAHERALPRRLAHAASRRALEVDFARAWPPAGALDEQRRIRRASER